MEENNLDKLDSILLQSKIEMIAETLNEYCKNGVIRKQDIDDIAIELANKTN